jgi:hypothetical protein
VGPSEAAYPSIACSRTRTGLCDASAFQKGSHMKMTVVGAISLAKNTYAAATIWIAPAALIRLAHLLERTGLATAGGSCGLYVAAILMRLGDEPFGSVWFILLVMLYGAFGFYVGIDLPGRPAQRSISWEGSKRDTDAAEIFGAIGTSLAAGAAFLSVSIIVLDQAVAQILIVLVACCWVAGSSLQIAAGAIARNHDMLEADGE